MSFFLFHLKRIFLFPIAIFTSPDSMIGAMWNESASSRALLLGLPAIVFAIIGVGVLCWAEYGMSASLENRYLARAEKSSKEKERISEELGRELRMLRASQQNVVDSDRKSVEELIPKDDPRRVQLEQWLDQEEVYLQKLIDLNEEEAEYKYQLAEVSMQKGNLNRGLALMNLTAPLDEPGYVKAHVWLADFHWKRARANRNRKTQLPMQNLL